MFKGNYTGLTRIEVEALRECFDFINNGYVFIVGYHDDKQWFIKLRHRMHVRYLKVYIHDWNYSIIRDTKCVKSVSVNPDDYRYDVVLHSELTINKCYFLTGGSEKLVSGSELPNNDELCTRTKMHQY